jgi:hypothetical protein
MRGGTSARLTMCVGCSKPFSRRAPATHCCEFRRSGFPFPDGGRHARPCGVAYHAGCVRVGEPFRTRLTNSKGLTLPHHVPMPHFVCEACQVRVELGRELHRLIPDLCLLMLERMRLIDTMSHWAKQTLEKYGPYLRYLNRFGKHFGVQPLLPSPLLTPPRSPAVSLQWALLYYSLRTKKGKDGEIHRIGFGTTRQIKSAASLYYTLDMQDAFPRQVLRDRAGRGLIHQYVSPCAEASMTFAAKGMSRRLGTASEKSWAISHVHVAYIDQALDKAYQKARTPERQHEIAVAAFTNLIAYLGWLRGGEIFEAEEDDLVVTLPVDGATRGLPPGVGAVEFSLLPETKSDPTIVADVVTAFTTMSGLSPGKWALRVQAFRPTVFGKLFSTPITPVWSSRHFRENFAIPLLEQMRRQGEPTLRAFSNKLGNRLQDKISSMHTWRRAGRSAVSRLPRHNEPNPPGRRKASQWEVYEHGRWALSISSENMPQRYNQWALSDRLVITLFCT